MASVTRQEDGSNFKAGDPVSTPAAGTPEPEPSAQGGGDKKALAPAISSPKPSQPQKQAPAKPGFFAIYKHGQGYNTRMGTVAGAALVILVTAYFLYTYMPTWGVPRNVTLGVVSLVVVGLALVAFMVINKPVVADFLIATDGEMKKVNWTTRKELIGSTKVVILFVFLITLVLFLFDVFFGYMFKLIHVLQFGPFGGS